LEVSPRQPGEFEDVEIVAVRPRWLSRVRLTGGADESLLGGISVEIPVPGRVTAVANGELFALAR
jgi:hypothetical protein